MSGFRHSPFDGDEYVALSLIRRRPALPVARDERKRALIKLAAVLLGYMAVVFVVLELSVRY
jgi:LPS O-antigen subunit length determinant protein (WzzB/FepE family)